MLDITLQFLKDKLNTYLLTRTGSSAEVVKLSRLVDEAGKYAFDKDTICATIINREEELTVKDHLPHYSLDNEQHVILMPELKLKPYVMFAANFKLYDVALCYCIRPSLMRTSLSHKSLLCLPGRTN